MNPNPSLPVLFLDTVHPLLKQGIEELGFRVEEDYDSSKEEVINRLAEYQGIVIRSRFKLDKPLLEKATQLRFIARVGAGMENIDVQAAEALGIRCLHAPEGNKTAVAEQVLAMLLGLFNNLYRANREVRQGLWIREGNRGLELEGKTLAIIGYGNMGSALAQRLLGFGCKVLIYDKYKLVQSPEGYKQVDIDAVYDQADIVSLHLPLTPETTFFANSTFFNSFRKPIWLVNTARGKCLKTTDLVHAMKQGKVLGACLDVVEYESLSFEYFGQNLTGEDKLAWDYLLSSDQVVLSPHIGGWTHESNLKMARVLVEKLKNLYS
ncbi:MAG: hydroxyacid dehydrogenase [Bacteroidia bacterium]|nr:hydroxyacid dehydrogenase [Bacteroidia bacterium]